MKNRNTTDTGLAYDKCQKIQQKTTLSHIRKIPPEAKEA